MHNNRNNRETVIIPQTIIVPTKSIIVASLVLSLLFFSSIQEKNLNSNHSPITKEKTRLQSSD